MSQLNILIEKDEQIITCKKKAKILLKQLKKTIPDSKLMHCQIKIAQQMGYLDWFDLYHSIKNKYELQLKNKVSLFKNFFETMLTESIDKDISDFHFEVRKEQGRIRVRQLGMMEYYQQEVYTSEFVAQLCQFIGQNISNQPNKFFDFYECALASAKYSFLVDNMLRDFNLRMQFVPAYPEGYDIVIKVIKVFSQSNYLQQLGFEKKQAKHLLNPFYSNNGLILIAGQTGAGKTKTLNTLFKEVYTDNIKKTLYSIEDPVEYKIDNVIQLNVEHPNHYESSYSKYEKSLQLCMNSDAQAILIEKCNDIATTRLVEKYAQETLIISSLNATCAIGILSRLEDFNLPYEKMADPDFIKVLAYQKLLPIVCPHCSHRAQDVIQQESIEHRDKHLSMLAKLEKVMPEIDLSHIRFRNEKACMHCNYGIKGRTVCAEVIHLDTTMYHFIEKKQLGKLYDYWRSLSDKNILSDNMDGKRIVEHALAKVLKGIIDPWELEHHFLPIEDIFVYKNYYK